VRKVKRKKGKRENYVEMQQKLLWPPRGGGRRLRTPSKNLKNLKLSVGRKLQLMQRRFLAGDEKGKN